MAHAGGAVEPQSEATPYSYLWEFSLSEIYLQSQENMRYFFTPSNAERTVFPAIGKVLEGARLVSESWLLRFALLLPIREESILDLNRQEEEPHFTFTKAIAFATERSFVIFHFRNKGRFELAPGAGIVHPLVFSGQEKLFIPEIGFRTRISLIDGAGLVGEFGYAGDTKTGTFFTRFGASYRL